MFLEVGEQVMLDLTVSINHHDLILNIYMGIYTYIWFKLIRKLFFSILDKVLGSFKL